MKVLVTGASGRLGAFVVDELEQAGHDLVLMSRTRPAAAEGWPWVKGDLTDFDACLRATSGVEAIQHLAATPYPTDHPETRARAAERGVAFDQTMRTNIMGTYYLLQAAVKHGVKTVVMSSSYCASGLGFRISGNEFPLRYLPVDEDHPSDIEDSYAFSKLVGEELLASYTRAYGLRTYALRFTGIFPPERRADTARRATSAAAWDPWLWAWVGSEDAASAHRVLMERAGELAPHQVFYCAADDTTALEPSRELVSRYRPNLLNALRGLDGYASFISNGRLREVGWEPRTSWREQK